MRRLIEIMNTRKEAVIMIQKTGDAATPCVAAAAAATQVVTNRIHMHVCNWCIDLDLEAHSEAMH